MCSCYMTWHQVLCNVDLCLPIIDIRQTEVLSILGAAHKRLESENCVPMLTAAVCLFVFCCLIGSGCVGSTSHNETA